MLSPGVEHLDLAVERIPGIEPLAAIAASPPLAAKRPEVFEIVED
jgi:hypothetical protein